MMIDIIKTIIFATDGLTSDIYSKFLIGAAIISVVIGFVFAARSVAKQLMEEENGTKPKKKKRKK